MQGEVRIKNVIADGLIMALSAALLWHFSNIWRYGQYLAEEPDVIIRSLETAGLLGIFIFGATKYISDMKRYEGKIGNRTKEMRG